MKVVAIAVLLATLALGAWGAHQAISAMQQAVVAHAKAAA